MMTACWCWWTCTAAPPHVTAANINRPVDGKVPNCECVSGVNLPMLIEAISMRDSMSLSELGSLTPVRPKASKTSKLNLACVVNFAVKWKIGGTFNG